MLINYTHGIGSLGIAFIGMLFIFTSVNEMVDKFLGMLVNTSGQSLH